MKNVSPAPFNLFSTFSQLSISDSWKTAITSSLFWGQKFRDKRNRLGDYSHVRNMDAWNTNKEHYAAQLYFSQSVLLLRHSVHLFSFHVTKKREEFRLNLFSYTDPPAAMGSPCRCLNKTSFFSYIHSGQCFSIRLVQHILFCFTSWWLCTASIPEWTYPRASGYSKALIQTHVCLQTAC